MRTIDLYNKMPEIVRFKLDDIKRRRKIAEKADRWHELQKISVEASAYCTGLRDAGLITDHERGTLYIYTTV